MIFDFLILLILVLISVQEIILPQQGIQYKQLELTIDPQNLFIGTFSKYCPFCNITNLGEVLRNESQTYLLTLARDELTNIILIQYVSFTLTKKIVHTITLKTNFGIISHDFTTDSGTYESTWFVSYVQIKQESGKILMGIRSLYTLQEEEFQFDQLVKNRFSLQIGGGLNFVDQESNTNYFLSSFPGELGLIINEEINISNILSNLSQCTKITNNNLLDYGNFTSTNYQQIITPLSYQNSYQLSFWVKVKLITSLPQTVYIIRLLINSQTDFINKVGSNSFILNYQYQNNQWLYYIEYYSYDFPYILNEQDLDQFKQYYIGNIDFIINWHLVQISYNDNILTFNSFCNDQKIINTFNSRQYSNIKLRIQLNGNIYEQSNAEIEIAQLNYYNYQQLTNYCHYSCHTCMGPFNYHCTSCNKDSFRIYNQIEHTCNCQLWYIENNQECQQGISNFVETIIYLPQDPRYDQIDPELICSFGYFKYNDECYQCPCASQETSLYCPECLLNPNTWIYSGLCNDYYVQNKTIYQFYVASSDYSIQFFLIHEQLFACSDCVVCDSEDMLDLEGSQCFLYPQKHIDQDVYITCNAGSNYDEDDQSCKYYKYISPIGRYSCGTYCGYCFFRVCYYCLDNEKYFLDREQICQPCTIQNCKYCFQYNIYNYNQISTRIQSAQEEYSTEPEDYALGCSLCYDGYIFDFSINKCILSNLGSDCLNGYIINGSVTCTSVAGPNLPHGIVQVNNCQIYLSFCEKCVKDNYNMIQCTKCQQGYYLNIDSFTCFPCSSRFNNAAECVMMSGGQDNWKFEVQSILMNFCPDHVPTYLVLNWQRYYLITKCSHGYEQSTDYDCVKTCGANCQNCVHFPGHLECQKCWFQKQEYESYSYFYNECQTCPYPCQFCLPQTQTQIFAANPYFQLEESQTYRCMKNFDNSQTFIEQLTGQTKQKTHDQRFKIQIQLNDQFDLNDMKRRKISTTVDKYNSERKEVPQNFRSKIFSITNSTVLYDGTNEKQQQKNIEINNQTQVNLENILTTSNEYQILISSLYGVTVYIKNLTLQNTKLYTPQIQITNLNNMTIDKLELNNLIINNTSVIDIISVFTKYSINLKINNLIISNCTFLNSSLLQFTVNSVNFIDIYSVNIYDSQFESSYFMNEINSLKNKQKFILRKLSISNTNFSTCNFLIIPVSDSISLYELFIYNIQVLNSTIIRGSNSIQIDTLIFQNIILLNSNLLKIDDATLYSSYHHTLNNIQLINITFYGANPIIISHNKDYTTSFTMTNINFQRNQFITNFNPETDSRCLFSLQISDVVIQNLKDDKQFGYINFCIKQSKSIYVLNCSISNSAFEETKQLSQSQQEFLRVENFQSLVLMDILLESQLIINNPLIFIQASNQEESQIEIKNTKFINTLSYKSEQFKISTLLQITADNYCNTYITDSMFINNTIVHQLQDLQIISPGLIFIETLKSLISISRSTFKNNEIQNTTYSLIQLDSDEIILSQLSISETNFASFQKNQYLHTGLISSIGGFSFIIGSIIRVYDSIFQNSLAYKGSCLYITTKDKGLIILQNIEIQNSTSWSIINDNSVGGSLVIDSSISSLEIQFHNILIVNSISKEAGGFLYLIPSQIQNQVIINSIKIKNSLARNSAIFELICPLQSINNYFNLQNLEIQQTTDIMEYYKTLGNQTVDIRGFIVVQNSLIQITKFQFIGIATLPILYLDYSITLTLANIFFSNVTVMDKYLIFIQNFVSIQSQQSNSTFQFSNFSIQGSQNFNNQTNALIIYQIAQSKNFHYIKFFNIEFLQNNCSCSEGLFQIVLENQNIKHLVFEELKFYGNICGNISCLVILNGSTNNNLKIMRSRFISNQGNLGGAIYSDLENIVFQQVLFMNNTAQQKGGALFINSKGENLIFRQTSFIKNKADIGGAINIEKGILNNFNKIYFSENKGLSAIDNIKEQPSLIEINILGFQIDSISIKEGYGTPNLMKYQSQYIYLPSGQSIGTYQRFGISDYALQIIAINQLREQQIDIIGSSCLISSQILSNNSDMENYDNNIQIFNFNEQQQSFDLSNLLIVLDPYQRDKYIQFNITCDCLYDQSYTLIIQAKTFKCQIGEYYYESKCLQCDADKGYYSVQYKANNCQKVDPQIIESNTASSIKLNSGYWRPNQQNPFITKCYNNQVACLGGWKVSDDSCLKGYIGGLCEECDIYNIRGYGQYYKNQSLKCTECGNYVGKIFFSIFIICLTLFSLFLTVNSVNIIFKSFKRLKLITKHYDIVFRNSLGIILHYIDQSAALIKMIMNYLQILVGIKSFRLILFIDIIDILIPISNPVSGSTYSFDCFYSQQLDIKIIYVDLIINVFLPLFYFLLFITFYLLLIYFKKTQLSQNIYFTALLYLLFYTQPNMIKELSLNLAQRTISNIQYINKNVQFLYNSQIHITWLKFYIIPLFLILGIFIPFCLLFLLFLKRTLFHTEKVRQYWGYVYNDYQRKSYFWEIFRILQREIVILSFAINEERIIINGIVIFIVLFIYYSAATIQRPFNIKSLNTFELKSILICQILIIISTLKYQVQLLEFIYVDFPLQIILVILLIYFIFTIVMKMISVYYNKYSERLDNMRLIIKKQFPKLTYYCPVLNIFLKLKKEEKARVSKRFNIIRNYFHSSRQLFPSVQNSVVQRSQIHDDTHNHTRQISHNITQERNAFISQVPDEIY